MDAAQAEFLQSIIDQRTLNLETWNFFVSVHIAIAGILFILQRRVHWPEKTVIIFSYSVFMFMNWSAQIANYEIFQEMISAWGAQGEASASTIPVEVTLSAVNFVAPNVGLTVTYAVAWALTALFVSFVNRLAARPRVD